MFGLNMREYQFYVYIQQSASRRALYIGMTNNLYRRMLEHKSRGFDGFASKYSCDRLVYHEGFDEVLKAIDREKQLKGWRREKKIALFEKVNPRWEDQSREWYEDLQRRHGEWLALQPHFG